MFRTPVISGSLLRDPSSHTLLKGRSTVVSNGSLPVNQGECLR